MDNFPHVCPNCQTRGKDNFDKSQNNVFINEIDPKLVIQQKLINLKAYVCKSCNYFMLFYP